MTLIQSTIIGCGRRLMGLALLGAILFAGCDEDPMRAGDQPADRERSPGVYVSLEPAPSAAAGDTLAVAVTLERVGVDKVIGSVQGEVGYDTEALEFTAARIPDGILGAAHEPERGRVRFAGISARGLPDGAVLYLEFVAAGASRAPFIDADFTLEVEELGELRDAADVTDAAVVPRSSLGAGEVAGAPDGNLYR